MRTSTAVTVLTDETFEDFVRGSAVPVVVDFWAEWCPPCRAIARSLDELAEEFAGRVAVASVDTDANPDVTRRYRVLSMPTLLTFRDGEPVTGMVGARPKAQLRELFADPERSGQ